MPFHIIFYKSKKKMSIIVLSRICKMVMRKHVEDLPFTVWKMHIYRLDCWIN